MFHVKQFRKERIMKANQVANYIDHCIRMTRQGIKPLTWAQFLRRTN